MNQQQVNTVLEQASRIESVNFSEIIQSLYPDNNAVDSIQLPNMSLNEFVHLSKKVMLQFIHHFQNREITIPLPYVFTHPQYGSSQVNAQIQSFFTYLQASPPDLNSAEQFLLWLADYQVQHNIYDLPSSTSEKVLTDNILRISEKLSLSEISIENRTKDVTKLFEELAKAKSEIETLIQQKREELTQISTNLTTANTQTTQISELLNKGTDQSSRLNSIVEQQESNKSKFEKQIAELSEQYNKTIEKFNESTKQANQKIEEFKEQVTQNDTHLKFVEGKREFFEERIKYLEDLIGREVGASLFETFKQRKLELVKPVQFWRWAVPVMALATIAWIFFLFSKQPDIKDINLWWQAFAVNTLKSIPAIFLLLFSINQYRKERNFQEEYAFKSSVALTIKAYANQLVDAKNKDTLIMEAVLGVYKTPIEEKHNDKIKSKTILETVKTMAETTRDLAKGNK